MLTNSEVLANILSAISQVGFPIVVTGYLLIRFEKKLEELTSTIARLTDVINLNQKESEPDGK